MEAASRPDLAGLLAHADVSQAAFARLAGVTARQVNNWCRGRAATPRWAMILAVVLQERSPEDLTMALEEALLPPPPTRGTGARSNVAPRARELRDYAGRSGAPAWRWDGSPSWGRSASAPTGGLAPLVRVR